MTTASLNHHLTRPRRMYLRGQTIQTKSQMPRENSQRRIPKFHLLGGSMTIAIQSRPLGMYVCPIGHVPFLHCMATGRQAVPKPDFLILSYSVARNIFTMVHLRR